AWHSSDLWYWFGTLKNGWRPFEQKDYDLSNVMSDYLCNFVKTGNPNGEGLVEWKQAKAGQKEVIRLGEGDVRMEKVCKLKLLWTTITNKNVGE
ncbi:MAG: carboxylesterase family protein, partial [Agathobacter sp.]|nr:carboxylesterase family protein [Agathobacter sp.]